LDVFEAYNRGIGDLSIYQRRNGYSLGMTAFPTSQPSPVDAGGEAVFNTSSLLLVGGCAALGCGDPGRGLNVYVF
jgi:hypothetical protein